MNNDDRAKFEALTDEQIIAIKKSTKCSDPYKPWGDTLAFARSILASAQAASAEPVAWQVRCDGGAWGPPTTKLKVAESFVGQDGYEVRPLYTTPAPAVAPAAVTEAVHPQSMRGLVEASGGNYLTGGGAAFTSFALAKFVVAVVGAARTPEPQAERKEPQ